MKLLLDNNLSFRLKTSLRAAFPCTVHVSDLNMDSKTEDTAVWKFALENDYSIVTKDNDFEWLSRFYGCPPKVKQLTCGNKKTSEIVFMIQKSENDIIDFLNSQNDCLLYLS